MKELSAQTALIACHQFRIFKNIVIVTMCDSINDVTLIDEFQKSKNEYELIENLQGKQECPQITYKFCQGSDSH